MATLSINNSITGEFVVLAESSESGLRVMNSASDPLVPKLRDLIADSNFGDLELRVNGLSQSEQQFEHIRQNVIQSLGQAIDGIKKSSLR